MELVVGLTSAISGIVVATITVLGNVFVRKKDNIAHKVTLMNKKLDKIGKGTAQSLKTDLQRLHERQQSAILNGSWSGDIDTVFRESYFAYKELGGNSIIDRLRFDMDKWRETYNKDIYEDGKKNHK